MILMMHEKQTTLNVETEINQASISDFFLKKGGGEEKQWIRPFFFYFFFLCFNNE